MCFHRGCVVGGRQRHYVTSVCFHSGSVVVLSRECQCVISVCFHRGSVVVLSRECQCVISVCFHRGCAVFVFKVVCCSNCEGGIHRKNSISIKYLLLL